MGFWGWAHSSAVCTGPDLLAHLAAAQGKVGGRKGREAGG